MGGKTSGWYWLSVASVIIASGAFGQLAEPKVRVSRSGLDPLPAISPGAVVRGTVTSEDGQPLEGVAVRYDFIHTHIQNNTPDPVYTDAEGRYEIKLPWAGVPYKVGAYGRAYGFEEQRIQASADQSLDFVMRPRVRREPERKANFIHALERKAYFTRGAVRDALSGDKVPGAEVVLCTSGNEPKHVFSDSKGEFSLSHGDGPGATRIYARHHGLVSPLTGVVGSQDTTIELVLGPPGALAGVVSTADDDTPAADCPVAITVLMKQPALTFEGRTDAAGYYTIENVPPGEYHYVVNLPRVGVGDRRFSRGPNKVTIAPGVQTRLDLQTEKRARIAGRVVGPSGEPAAYAIVDSSRLPRFKVAVDGQGRFSEAIPPHSRRRLTFFHPEYGIGAYALADLEPGEEKRDIEIRLNGIARLHGKLKSERYEAVSDVKILGTVSNDSGYFDSGPIPVPLDPEGFEIKMYPPRPDNGLFPWLRDDGSRLKNDRKTQYYHTPPIRVAARHGEDVYLDIVLVEAHLRELRGTVQDLSGKPGAGVRVHLYAGMPTTSQWLEDIAPDYPGIAQTIAKGSRPATLVARAVTGEQGEWNIRMVREAVRSVGGYGDEYHADSVVILASDNQQRTMAMAARRLDDHSVAFEFPLVLRPAPADLAMLVKCMDGEGEPIPGLEWVVDTFHGPYVSDSDGLVSVPRISERPGLRLLTEGYRIAGAVVDKAVLRKAASRTGGIPYVGTQSAFQHTWQVAGPPPRFRVRDSFVDFDFVADEDAAILITLSRVDKTDGVESPEP